MGKLFNALSDTDKELVETQARIALKPQPAPTFEQHQEYFENAIESIAVSEESLTSLRQLGITKLKERLERAGVRHDIQSGGISEVALDDLRVGGSLNLSYIQITTLPENLQVGGDLVLDDKNQNAVKDAAKEIMKGSEGAKVSDAEAGAKKPAESPEQNGGKEGEVKAR